MYIDEEVRKFHGHFTSALGQTPCWREAFSFICMKATKMHCMPTFSLLFFVFSISKRRKDGSDSQELSFSTLAVHVLERDMQPNGGPWTSARPNSQENVKGVS
ncbi:hypothetical protein NC653_009232 [Populus alba x Populus x berolinensis]|uniref:Uncharacterized protein n=1 Tax=Populus alba x Populus x berolinensis TaxID=444605 RepID=A0AAD6R8F4_9ROSI|nr:hypothetical protein NC653_009232 [Populus alba x Populus x berolinensis]